MAWLEIGAHRLSEAEGRKLLATDHPMVQQFRLDNQRQQAGQRVDFALVIVPRQGVRYQQQRDENGARCEPVWRTLTGEETIGQGNRSIWQQDDQLVAANHTFFPNQRFNDLGIGSALYVSMERLYRHLGVKRVGLLAVDVGIYMWARQGFAFVEPGQAASLVPSLDRFLYGNSLPTVTDEGALEESWDLANYDVAGHEVDHDRVGKAFMLQCGPAWHGVKYLDDPKHNSIADSSRRETFARLPGKIECAPPTLQVR
jgi:hypothetical protein